MGGPTMLDPTKKKAKAPVKPVKFNLNSFDYLQNAIEKAVGKRRADKFYSPIEGPVNASSFKMLINYLNMYEKFTPMDRENIRSALIKEGHKDIANMIK